MSGSIEKLTAALEANTAAIEAMVKASGGKPASGAAKPAAVDAKPAAGKAKPAAKKGKTLDDVAAAFGAFLDTKDAETRTERKSQVRAVLDHYGADRATKLDAENFEGAIAYLQQFLDGEVPDFMDEGEEAEDDESLV